MLVDDVQARLKAEVNALEERVEGAAELAPLVGTNKWPQRTPASYVLPLGFDARDANSVTGMFTQMLGRGIGVVLFNRAAGDATGAKSIATIDTLEAAVLQALAGWQPSSEIFGVLVPVRGRLISLVAGAVIYQVDFRIDDQLRIPRQ